MRIPAKRLAGLTLIAVSALVPASVGDAADYVYRYKWTTIPSAPGGGGGTTDPVSIALGDAAPASLEANVGDVFSLPVKPLATVTGGSGVTRDDLAFSMGNPVTPSTSAITPPWLTIDAGTGIATGTPHTIGNASYEIVATYTDPEGETKEGRKIYTIKVNGAVLKVIQIASGSVHTCAVTTSNGLKCWGDNTYRQLGSSSVSQSTTPIDVPGMASGVSMVAAGHQHTCAVQSGAVKCWGYNATGAVGTGSPPAGNVSSPFSIPSLASGVTQVVAGLHHSCALQGGGVLCWGYNWQQRLGTGNGSQYHLSPAAVLGMESGVSEISAGESVNTCAIKDGGAWCWGYNQYGQAGDRTLAPEKPTAVQVYGLSSGVTSIAVGTNHACAVHNGAAKCWGYNQNGQIGVGTVDTTSYSEPQNVSGLGSGVSMIAADYNHTCAIKDGGAWCWGANDNGKLGNGASSGNSGSPAPVTDLGSGVASISAGGGHTCARTSSGAAKCWGAGNFGQIGAGDTSSNPNPTDVRPN